MIRLLTREAGSTELVFQEFDTDFVPPYAILSHTWLQNHADEVTFEDINGGRGQSKRGWTKVEFCATQAHSAGLAYFWIDTCCVDKSDVAELTESINSMFNWYQHATRCFVYLADVLSGQRLGPEFAQSRWFTRGWTLQELIAPKVVEFYSSDG